MELNELDDDRVGKILTYLSRTDDEFAVAKANLENAEILRKRVRARAFIESEGSVAERNAESELHDDVQAADDAYIAARVAFEKLKAHRERGDQFVEIYRTLSSNRRAGMTL